LQRLFSAFAEGWPGFGLLVQRILTSIMLFYFGVTPLLRATTLEPNLLNPIGAVAGIFLLLGLWTPAAGIAVAAIEVWKLLARPDDPAIALMLAALGATLAMIGPGVWSIDARLYGRKHIEPARY
jgi:hypothetical protein